MTDQRFFIKAVSQRIHKGDKMTYADDTGGQSLSGAQRPLRPLPLY